MTLVKKSVWKLTLILATMSCLCNLPRHNKQGYIVPDCVIFGVGEKYGNLIGGNAYKVPEQIAEEANA